MRSMRPIVMSLLVASSLLVAPATPAADAAMIEPGVLQRLGTFDVLARFDREVPRALLDAELPNVTMLHRFGSLPAVAARVDQAGARAIAALPGLAYLEADKPIEFELDSATVATRARDVWAPTGGHPVRDDQNRIVDGTGVGIAVVDTGLDGLHPDFQVPGKVAANYQVTLAGMVEAPFTTTLNVPHGTHVAGIALGGGELSGGLFRGVAPGASLYSFNIFHGADPSLLLPAIAFDWILQHGDDQDPPIRVVNNSWRCSAHVCRNAFNPERLHTQLASQLAVSGVTITWSAGNDWGDGSAALTNPDSRNPTPGIIGVANYKDERSSFETGVRDNRVSGTSSRGDSSDPTTWPDVAAPGRDVMSTWGVSARLSSNRYAGRNPLTNENAYFIQDGTSMAAPHVAGIVALMLQVNPSLTPGEIEYIIKQTSTELPNPIGYVRADPVHTWNGANYEDGHGLVDALAAVQLADGFTGIPPMPDPETIPESFIVSIPGIDVEQTLYVNEGEMLTRERPASASVAHQDIGQTHVYTSEPFTDPTTFDAVEANLFIGTFHEYVADTHAHLRFLLTVQRVAASGARTDIGAGIEYTWHTVPVQPLDRRFRVFLDAPVTIPAGERFGFRLVLQKTPGTPEAIVGDRTLLAGGTLLYSGRPTLSRIGLGARVAHPVRGSDIACRARQDCGTVGGEAEATTLSCWNEPVRLRWAGPAGSALEFDCDGNVAVCQIPGRPGDPAGDCELQVDPVTRTTNPVRDGVCRYVTQDGALGGRGRCESLTFVEGRN